MSGLKSDTDGTVAFTYDALSRTTQADNEDGSNTAYTYDAAGNRLSITYPDATAVTTTYNTLGNVSSFMDYDGSGTTYTRDAEGRVTKESHSDGSTTEYAYNAAGQLTMQREVDKNNTTRRTITYAYDDAGNLTSENRSGVDIDKKDELVRYYYDAADRLMKTSIEGVITDYSYDKAGNLLSDGAYTYTYDQQNRLLSKTGTDGATNYTYDAAGNLMKETGPDGSTTYTYSAQNKLVLGETDDGQSSAYTYNAMGARIENTQVRENQNAGYQNSNLKDGSASVDYMEYLQDLRASLQRVWETEVGTTVQNNYETVTKHYVVDYLSAANRDILVTEDGSFTQRYVYDASGTRISAEFDYADGTARGATNANGEYGENLQSDFAANDVQKVWYRTSLVSSTLFAVDETGATISHMIYDPWGNPLSETYTDTNLSGIDNLNNYTGYTWDETLGLYYAQNRFYDAENHRFTQEDTVKDGANWYIYCENNPLIYVDMFGLSAESEETGSSSSMDEGHKRSLLGWLIANDFNVKATQQGWFQPFFYLAGFESQDKKNNGNRVYWARQDCIQQYGGYNSLYDAIFDRTTDMLNAQFIFTSTEQGEEQGYVFWVWKGDYLNLGAGAELGIYKQLGSSTHYIVDHDLAMPMHLDLYVYDNMEAKKYHAENPEGGYGGKFWWITIFYPRVQGKNAANMTAVINVDFSGKTQLYEDFWETWSDSSMWNFSGNHEATLTF